MEPNSALAKPHSAVFEGAALQTVERVTFLMKVTKTTSLLISFIMNDLQWSCCHVSSVTVSIADLGTFKINSEARSRGIVCEQGLGDHA